MAKIIDSDGVRQGETPRRVRYVLGFSLVGIIAAFAIVVAAV